MSDKIKITSINAWHDSLINLVGVDIPNKDSIEALENKELLSFLRSALTTNRLKTPVFLIHSSPWRNDSIKSNIITSTEFFDLFSSKFNKKVIGFKDNYRNKEGELQIISLLEDRFPDEIKISKNYRTENVYEKVDKNDSDYDMFRERKVIGTEEVYNGISQITLYGELFDKIYKDKFSFVDYYFYFIDFGFKKLEEVADANIKQIGDNKLAISIERSDVVRDASNNIDAMNKIIDGTRTIQKKSSSFIEKAILVEKEVIFDEKLQTAPYKLLIYKKLFPDFNIHFKFVLNSWFCKPSYIDVLDYIKNNDCTSYVISPKNINEIFVDI